MKMTKILIICLVIAAILAAAAIAAPRAPKDAKGNMNANWWGKAPGQRTAVKGTVASISATSISVQAKEGLKAFVVTDKTRVVIQGHKASIGDVKAGDKAVVKFALQSNNVPLALDVRVPKPTFGGEVVSVQGNAITVRNKKTNEQQIILFNEKTKFHSKSYQGSIDDIKPGVRIAAVGTAANNQLTADVIEFMPEVIKGAVVAVDGDVITVKTVHQKSVALKASPKTAVLVRPRVGPNQKGTLADVKVGTAVNAGFEPAKDSPSPLLWIDVLTAM